MRIQISIDTLVKASLSDVWGAWTTPEDIMEWNAATSEWHTPRASIKLEPGGAFSYRMEARDGSAGFDFTGTFLRVEHEELIEFSLDDDRRVAVTFTQEEGGVRVAETFEAEDEHSAEQQRAGWQAILHRFARYVETKPKSVSESNL